MIVAARLCNSLLLSLSNQRLFSSIPSLEQSIQTLIEDRTFHKIPDLLPPSPYPQKNPNPNPFSFLSSLSPTRQTQIIDQILQSVISIKPRSRLHPTYSFLLSQTLKSPNTLPISLAVLQSTIRSGHTPAPQTRLSLSTTWLDLRRSQSVTDILTEMHRIGYNPDRNTCNYLLSSLCSVDQISEAVKILKEMRISGCDPDSESYDIVIGALCKRRRTDVAAELVTEMVEEMRLTPKQRTVVNAVAAMRANGEMRRAVEIIGVLERRNCEIGFQSYEMAVEGCLERKEFVLAGKVVMEMVGKRYIPYIRVRQKVVEGLAGIGQEKLACAVRQRLAELQS